MGTISHTQKTKQNIKQQLLGTARKNIKVIQFPLIHRHYSNAHCICFIFKYHSFSNYVEQKIKK